MSVCTCAGTAPGYPQHESGCGQPEIDDDGDWWFSILAARARYTAEAIALAEQDIERNQK